MKIVRQKVLYFRLGQVQTVYKYLFTPPQTVRTLLYSKSEILNEINKLIITY